MKLQASPNLKAAANSVQLPYTPKQCNTWVTALTESLGALSSVYLPNHNVCPDTMYPCI